MTRAVLFALFDRFMPTVNDETATVRAAFELVFGEQPQDLQDAEHRTGHPGELFAVLRAGPAANARHRNPGHDCCGPRLARHVAPVNEAAPHHACS